MSETSTPKNMWLAWAALGVVCILWGTTFLAIRIGVMDIPPFLFSALRLSIAGLAFTIFMRVGARVAFPDKAVVITQALAGFAMFTIGNGLISFAELYVSSGITAIICSMIPIWVILLNVLSSSNEKPTLSIILGVLIGLGGIVLMFSDNLHEFSNSGYAWGIVMIFIANMGWSFGSVWIKKKNIKSNAFMNAGLQMLFGGLFQFPVSFIADDYSTLQWTSTALWALAYLIVFGSIIAFACYSYALKKLPITIVSLYAYINPIVAVLLGSWMLNEPFTLKIALSMLITIVGIYIVNRGYQLRTLWKTQFSKS